ncbi:MAG: hypothetical protein JWN04_4603 [Myxococcaceae bacterium]|nr:hypothetical protein [Myxococcaceae bacterium]
MSKLIALSIVLAMVAIPIRAASDPDPRQGLRRAVIQMLAFEAIYTFSMIYLWGRW